MFTGGALQPSRTALATLNRHNNLNTQKKQKNQASFKPPVSTKKPAQLVTLG